MRSATFEAVRVYLGVRAFQETDEDRLRAYLMEKVTHTGNFAALSQAAMDWLVSEGHLTPSWRNDPGALDLPGPQSSGRRAL